MWFALSLKKFVNMKVFRSDWNFACNVWSLICVRRLVEIVSLLSSLACTYVIVVGGRMFLESDKTSPHETWSQGQDETVLHLLFSPACKLPTRAGLSLSKINLQNSCERNIIIQSIIILEVYNCIVHTPLVRIFTGALKSMEPLLCL